MNNKGFEAWDSLKWFYRFSVVVLSIILVYVILYSSFNFELSKVSFAVSIPQKIYYSDAFKLDHNSNIIDYDKFNVDSLKEYFYFNSPRNTEVKNDDSVLNLGYTSPFSIHIILSSEDFEKKELYYPSEEDFKFLFNSFLKDNKDIYKVEKIFLVKVKYKDEIVLSKLKFVVLSFKN